MYKIIFLFGLISIIGINSSVHNTSSLIDYTDWKAGISKNKPLLAKQSLATKQAYLFEVIAKSIPAYWIGTTWDFNGVTRTPQKGAIACGYFITTVLEDIGIQLERVKLAQQVSSVMIKKLTVKVKNTTNFSTLKTYISTGLKNDIFIIGLDFHTGFIVKEGTTFYFLHSNYINREGVIKENIENSAALKGSSNYMIGSLLQNEILVQKWAK